MAPILSRALVDPDYYQTFGLGMGFKKLEGLGYVGPCWCSAQQDQANDIAGLSLVRVFLQYNL